MAKQITLEEIQFLDHSKLSNMLYEMIDTNEELYIYPQLEPQKDLQKCIDEIDEDPLSTFWG